MFKKQATRTKVQEAKFKRQEPRTKIQETRSKKKDQRNNVQVESKRDTCLKYEIKNRRREKLTIDE